MVNAPDNLADLRRHLGRALAFIADHHDGYQRAWEYHDGTRAEVSASKTVRKLIEQNAEAMPISLAHIPVDVIVEKVELTGLTAKDANADKTLQVVIDGNDLVEDADDMILRAGIFGDYYAIVDPTELEAIDETTEQVTAEGIRVVGSSPLSTVVIYDSRYGRDALFGAKTWSAGDSTRALLYYDDATVKLVAASIKGRAVKPDDFELDGGELGEEGAYLPHEGGRMLICHLPIGSKPYGTPLHKKAWGPQDAITKISATNLNNVDGQGFASRWALADPLAELDDDIDDDFGDNGPTTDPAKGDGIKAATSGTSRVRSIPGAIALLRGIKEVGQFDAEDSENFIKNLDWYIRVMAVACGVALFEFDMQGNQPSGESRRRAESRSIKRAQKVARSAGAFMRDIADTALGLLGIETEVTASFAPFESATDAEGLELVAKKIAAGVPVTIALIEAGYPGELVETWYPDGQPHITPGLLTVLAAALQQLGQAKTLGVITDGELAEMLPTILTAARGEGPAAEPDDVEEPELVTDAGSQLKAQADALGILVRAGADPEQAAGLVGLDGLEFPNVPTTVRIPEDAATGLEGTGAPAPAAPEAPAA